MAMTSAVVRQGRFSAEFTVISDNAADAGELLIAHGMPVTPDEVVLTPMLVGFYTSTWFLTTLTAVNIGVTKIAGAGGANAAPQLRVQAVYHHSIQR